MINLFKTIMSETVSDSIREVIQSGYIGEGEKVKEFERLLSSYLGTENILTLNSCTSALSLALHLAGVSHGDEVLSTPFTCLATNTPIKNIGAKIVWVDIDPKTGNLDIENIIKKKKITSKTKAIVVVDWAGYPNDYLQLSNIARKFGLKIIVDSAHSFGSSYFRKLQSTCYIDYQCFSFQAIKMLTTIDGGLLVTKSKDDYERGKRLRWFGIDRSIGDRMRCLHDVEECGFKYHMNDVNAAVGINNFNNVYEEELQKRKFNVKLYEEIYENKKLHKLNYEPGRESCYWLYSLTVDDREKFIDYMNQNGVETSRVYVRNDTHYCFRESSVYEKDLPGVKEFDNNQISIPIGSWVSEQDIETIKDLCLNYK